MRKKSGPLQNATPSINVRSSGYGQKREKIKPSFAKGLWRMIFQCPRVRCYL